MTKITAEYVVNADAGDLEGWTPETLAAALREPLAALGVKVVCDPRVSGGGGLRVLDDPEGEEWDLQTEVEHITDQIIIAGPPIDPADLVVCQSADGWSLHAPGSTDEQISTGDAPYIIDGPGEPSAADRKRAAEMFRADPSRYSA